MDAETSAIVQGIKEQISGISHRLDKLEGLTSSVHEVALSVREMSTKQQDMEEKLDAMTSSVNELKAKPGDRWDKAMLTIMTAALTALATIIVQGFIK